MQGNLIEYSWHFNEVQNVLIVNTIECHRVSMNRKKYMVYWKGMSDNFMKG